MFRGAKLSQDLSGTKFYFECRLWVLSVMHTAFYNWKKSSNFDVNAGLLFTAWTNVLSQIEGTDTFSG